MDVSMTEVLQLFGPEFRKYKQPFIENRLCDGSSLSRWILKLTWTTCLKVIHYNLNTNGNFNMYTCTLKKESNCSASGISIASPENPSSEKNKMHTIKEKCN